MKSFVIVAALALGAACGGTPAKTPAISVKAPLGGSSVALGTDADKSVPLEISLTNFDVKPAGTCGVVANCGHIHVLIDGSACTPTDSHGPYNNTDEHSNTTAVARFAKCNLATGQHTVTLELHTNEHDPIDDSAGHPIQATVTFDTH